MVPTMSTITQRKLVPFPFSRAPYPSAAPTDARGTAGFSFPFFSFYFGWIVRGRGNYERTSFSASFLFFFFSFSSTSPAASTGSKGKESGSYLVSSPPFFFFFFFSKSTTPNPHPPTPLFPSCRPPRVWKSCRRASY